MYNPAPHLSEFAKQENIETIQPITRARSFIWGRGFEFDIIIDTDEQEYPMKEQLDALASFAENHNELLDEALPVINKFVMTEYVNNPSYLISHVELNAHNIFSFVTPKSIVITLPYDDFPIQVLLVCNYKFDEDNGIVIVYENNNIIGITSEEMYH